MSLASKTVGFALACLEDIGLCVVQLDEGVWFTRPLTSKIIDAACKDVKYLIRLRCELLERRMDYMGLNSGIGYYIDSLRRLSDEQYQDYVNSEVGQVIYCF